MDPPPPCVQWLSVACSVVYGMGWLAQLCVVGSQVIAVTSEWLVVVVVVCCQW